MRATHCHTTPTVIAVLEPTVIAALDAAISFYIDCRAKPDNDRKIGKLLATTEG